MIWCMKIVTMNSNFPDEKHFSFDFNEVKQVTRCRQSSSSIILNEKSSRQTCKIYRRLGNRWIIHENDEWRDVEIARSLWPISVALQYRSILNRAIDRSMTDQWLKAEKFINFQRGKFEKVGKRGKRVKNSIIKK